MIPFEPSKTSYIHLPNDKKEDEDKNYDASSASEIENELEA